MHHALILGLAVGVVAFFPSQSVQAQSVTVQMSPDQMSAFCTANGTTGGTKVDLRLPNGDHVSGTVDCNSPAGSVAANTGEQSAS